MEAKLCPASVVSLVLVLIQPAFCFSNDSVSEELFIKALPSGHVHFHFQFTTRWNIDIRNAETFTHYRLFPKALGDILSAYDVQELHLSLTHGVWRHEKWGYPIHDAPPGAELWVWFLPRVSSISYAWTGLVNALSGLFCASLNFMDSKVTVNPHFAFQPEGLQAKGFAGDFRFVRHSSLPREVVCTENLTPWKKLLPCDFKVGIAVLLNAMKLYDTSYHSLSVHVRPACKDVTCMDPALELTQSLSVIFDPTLFNKGYQSWSLKKLFGRSLRSQCPLADISNVYVDITENKGEQLFTLSPGPDSVVDFTRGGVAHSYAVYNVGEKTAGGTIFNLASQYKQQLKYEHTNPPSLYAHRYITGYGLERGGITCHMYNHFSKGLRVIYMENLPWYMRVYFNTLKISTDRMTIRPIRIHYLPGKDRVQSYHLELVFELPAKSVTTLTFEFDRAFLKWTEYPPDANHGFYVGSAVISALLPTAQNYTATTRGSSIFQDNFKDDSKMFFVRIHTESLLLSLPTPDFSMPYNVICLACTVVAIAFGSIHNLTTRRLVARDPDLKTGLLSRLKDLLQKLLKRSSTLRNAKDEDVAANKNVNKIASEENSRSDPNSSVKTSGSIKNSQSDNMEGKS